MMNSLFRLLVLKMQPNISVEQAVPCFILHATYLAVTQTESKRTDMYLVGVS